MHHQSQQSHLSQPVRGLRPGLLATLGRLRRVAGMVVGSLALVVTIVPSSPATAAAPSAYLCSGYSGCQAAGYGNAGYREAASTSFWRMYGGHNCTNYIAYRLIQNGMSPSRPWAGNGDASNWGAAMASITDQTPRVGAIAWYRANTAPAGSSGHVAYVEQVVSPTEIIVSEDYWGGDFHWRRVTTTSGWPSGFIHFNDAAIEPTTAPVISGTPMVGAPLEVAPGAWSPAPSTVTYRWLADGAVIPGAVTSSYVPTPEVKGKTLTAEVTAALSGYSPGAATLTTAPVAPGALQPTALPTIQGIAEVGQSLTLTPTAWSPQPSRATTQWYADGQPVPNATGPTFVLGRDQVGARITARVTGSSQGYRKSRANAPATDPVLAKAVRLSAPSTMAGRAQVASVLTARAGTARPRGAAVSYAWLRDGKPIAKAKNRRYTLRPKDLGRTVSVQVTSSHRNYRATTETLATQGLITTVPVVRAKAKAVKRSVTVDLRVKAPGAPAPDGTITVRVGGQTIEGQLTKGRERLVVRGLAPGRYRVLVRYAGTALVQPSTARATVKVGKRHR